MKEHPLYRLQNGIYLIGRITVTEYKISSIIAAEKQNIQAQAECSANEDSVVSAAPAEDEMVAEVLANASFARMYNKENAWKYAYTYATSTTTSTANSYYNTDIFNDYSGPDAGDCMNFASQAIYAGFSGSNNLTSVNAGTAPQDTVGIAVEMSRNVQSGNTQNLKSMVIQRSFPKRSVAERRKTAAASDQAAVCACAHSRYFAGGSPSGLRV